MWLKNEFVVLNSGKSLCSRGSFPECILEDSGFEEPQEFRTRCSSLAGSLQRKPGEGVIMGPPRRRHSSAPNHVQPSNAEKNRTMLFQVHTTKKLRCEITCFLFLCNWVRVISVLTDFCVGGTVQEPRILFLITVVCSQMEGMNTVNHWGNILYILGVVLWK